MKKMILVCSFLALGTLGLSSCVKVYNCTCTTESTDTVTKSKVSAVTVNTTRNSSKNIATAKCKQNEVTYISGREKNVVTCELKTPEK